MQISTIGLDIAKHVFQVHAVDAEGTVVTRKRYSRAQLVRFFEEIPPCLVGIEACGTAHYWGRLLKAFGHDVRLMPAHYVKPYVKRGKNDAADAEGICEAVTRPTMRFFPVTAPDTQALALMHRLRTQFVGQRTGMLMLFAPGWPSLASSPTRGLAARPRSCASRVEAMNASQR
jgi:transposase